MTASSWEAPIPVACARLRPRRSPRARARVDFEAHGLPGKSSRDFHHRGHVGTLETAAQRAAALFPQARRPARASRPGRPALGDCSGARARRRAASTPSGRRGGHRPLSHLPRTDGGRESPAQPRSATSACSSISRSTARRSGGGSSALLRRSRLLVSEHPLGVAQHDALRALFASWSQARRTESILNQE